MSEYITHSRAETVALGKRMAAVLAPGALIAFTGGLGAGKTAFTEGLAEGRAEGRAEGLSEGIDRGEARLGALVEKLIGAGRMEDVSLAAKDADARRILFAEFDL